eukprot:12748653-Heterocapsa_arctica.AAC.1
MFHKLARPGGQLCAPRGGKLARYMCVLCAVCVVSIVCSIWAHTVELKGSGSGPSGAKSVSADALHNANI